MTLDEDTRVRLSAQPGTESALLHELAVDPSVTVRATLAMNPAVSADTNAVLARDSDERVRALLARKLASLAPALSDGARTRLQRETLDTLTRLAEDEAVRVRAAVAEVVKDLPDAPRDLILRLAQDEATSVYEPVIQFSPMLTTDDLVALVASQQSTGTRLAVARRFALAPDVSDALASDSTEDVILALLMNQSAQIREATLDALAERSAVHPAWHSPLVHRPALSTNAVRTLSRFVADHLLQTLAARGDLDPTLAAEVRVRVSARLQGDSEQGTPAASPGKATETELLAAAQEGDARRAAVLLANAANVPLPVVRRATTLRSAKGLVSLTWKAGFTMKSGYAMQILLARLSPAVALKPGPGNSYPLSVQEMLWQIDFLVSSSR